MTELNQTGTEGSVWSLWLDITSAGVLISCPPASLGQLLTSDFRASPPLPPSQMVTLPPAHVKDSKPGRKNIRDLELFFPKLK